VIHHANQHNQEPFNAVVQVVRAIGNRGDHHVLQPAKEGGIMYKLYNVVWEIVMLSALALVLRHLYLNRQAIINMIGG
jgi:hypothetical protein